MIRKILLCIIFVLICTATYLLVSVNNFKVDDLKLHYSVYLDGELSLYDGEDNLLGNYTCTGSKETCFLAYSYQESKLDIERYVYEDMKSIEMTLPINGGAFIHDGDLVYYVDLSNGSVLKEYRDVKYLNNDYIALKDTDGNVSLAELSSSKLTYITESIYTYVGSTSYSNNFLVEEGETQYLINSSGNEVSTKFSGSIINYNDDFIIVKENNLHYIYNYSGDKTLLNGYTFARLDKKYIYVVSNNLLVIYDVSFNRINDEPINLGTVNNWDTYNIYSDSREYIDTSAVFTSSNNYYEIVITTNTEENTVKIDSDFTDYYSFSNNSIYFYEDLYKENLRSKYDCSDSKCKFLESSKLITQITEEYSDTFIDNRYVVINDEVGFVYDINSKEKSFEIISFQRISENDMLYTNKDGLYGLISFEDGVTSLADAIYESVVVNDNKMILKSNNNSYEYIIE
ncbi:MAG: hypothetical protein R3Y13_04325 [bacterium]